jgi:hypothetical protein
MEDIYMTKRNVYYGVFRLMLALVLGIFISAFSYGAVTAHAAEASDNGYAVVEDAAPVTADNAESADGSGAMIILLGGMLLIIIAVVITVVASFVVTAPIVDEI